MFKLYFVKMGGINSITISYNGKVYVLDNLSEGQVDYLSNGACKAFNITDDFIQFIDLHAIDYGDVNRFTTILEFDYWKNKYSYQLEPNQKKKKFDTVNNPVVEILFSERKNLKYSYRLVLGEKLNRLAYIEMNEYKNSIKYNNYSPDLPSWPFAINVTVDSNSNDSEITTLDAYTKNGDGFDKITPFLSAGSDNITVKYMSVRSRNKNVKLVGFYDCSTKYGLNCGTEKTQTIRDCKEKFSPLGSGFYNNFVDMSKYNRLGKKKSEVKIFEYKEIFGIYRRNNDNMHIFFTTEEHTSGTYVRITIGDEIMVRVRTLIGDDYFEKTAVKKGWSQEPSEPNFINVTLSSVTKQISIYNVNATDDEEPILTMKLCSYFNNSTIQYMSVTSNRFKTVDLYYDCCLPKELHNCHVYEKNDTQLEIDYTTTITDSDDFMLDSTTLRLPDEYTTLDSNEITMMNGNIDATLSIETKKELQETSTETETEVYEEFMEMKTLEGDEKTKTFLDTRKFHDILSTLYIYANGTSMTDYCENEIANAMLLQTNDEAKDDEEDPDISYFSSSVIRSLMG